MSYSQALRRIVTLRLQHRFKMIEGLESLYEDRVNYSLADGRSSHSLPAKEDGKRPHGDE